MRRLVTLILWCPLFAFAQQDSSQWSIGVGGSFDRTYRWLSTDGEEAIKELYDTLESQDFGMSVRFITMYKLSENLDITSGLAYARRGFQVDTLKSAGIKDMIERFHQIEIPIGVRFHFLKKESRNFFIDAGLFGSYMLKHQGSFRTLIRDTETRFSNTSNYNTIGFGWSGGVGFQAQLNDTYAVSFDLSYRQSLNSIAEGNLARRLNAAAIGIAIIHDL
jgi:hypothetical protein